MDDSGKGLGAVVGGAAGLIVSVRNSVAAALVIGTGLYAAADLFLEPSDALRAMALIGLVTLYLQLLVTARALPVSGHTPPGWNPGRPTMGRYPRAFGISIISTIAVLAGLVLLVVPGLVLLVRWSLAYPVMLAEDRGIVDSLRRSWELTRVRWPLLVGFGALILCLYVPGVALSFFLYPEFGRVSLIAALAANLAVMAAQIFSWLLAVALYALLRNETDLRNGVA